MVTLALFGAVALPATAGQTNDDESVTDVVTQGDDGASAAVTDRTDRAETTGSFETDQSDGEIANPTTRSGDDDDGLVSSQSVGEDPVTVYVGSQDTFERDDEMDMTEDPTNLEDDDPGELDGKDDDLVRLDVGDTEVSAETPPEEDTNTVEVGPFGR